MGTAPKLQHIFPLRAPGVKTSSVIRSDRLEVSTRRLERAEAIQLLQRIEHGGAFRALLAPDASPWTVNIVSTVTRWRRYLDFLLNYFSRRPVRNLEPALRQVLLLGIGELVILHTAVHAAVNEYVSLARSVVRPGAAGFVNGILRAVARNLDALPKPETGDLARDLAIRWSHPTWMVRRYISRFSLDDTVRLLQCNNAAPAHYVRVARDSRKVVTDHFSKAGIAYTPARYLEDYIRVDRLGSIIRSGWAQDGTCAVHDQSAGLVVDLLDPQPDETVLDACAAPGGKTFSIAARMQGEGKLLAWDTHEGRLGRLKAGARAQSIQMISAAAHNLKDAPMVTVDRLLVDAPCTGTGVLAKRADLRWRRTSEDLAELVTLQDILLDAAAARVRVGGTMVYSTCSLEPEENEERVVAFLGRDARFELVPAFGLLSDDVVTESGCMATLPHVHGMDGAFAARLQRIK